MNETRGFVGVEEGLTERVIGVFYKVYNDLGYGFVESVYARAMAIALTEHGLSVASEVAIPVSYHGQLVGSFRADVLVEKKVILEFKIADQILKPFEAQLTNYLRASTYEVGLILSFGQSAKFRRIEFLNARKRKIPGSPPIPSLSLSS